MADGGSMDCGNGTQSFIPTRTWFTQLAQATGRQTGSLHTLIGRTKAFFSIHNCIFI